MNEELERDYNIPSAFQTLVSDKPGVNVSAAAHPVVTRFQSKEPRSCQARLSLKTFSPFFGRCT